VSTELTRIRSQLDAAVRLVDVRALTEKAEQTMLDETRDWFGVLRFHGFEPHV
jgi:hypothetical protein